LLEGLARHQREDGGVLDGTMAASAESTAPHATAVFLLAFAGAEERRSSSAH
jgi:hypothetical protein